MRGVADNRPARAVLAGGCLVLGAWAVDFLAEGSRAGLPYVVAVAGLYVFGFVAVARRGVPAASSAIAAGGIAGVSAALVPAPVFAFRPPVPASIGWAFAVIAAAMATAAVVTAAVLTPAVLTARRDGARFVEAALSGLLAGVVASLLIVPVVATMLRFGPEGWVPEMTSYALTPAAQLAERRHLGAEPYLLVSLLGAGLALMLGVLAVRTRRRVRTTPPVRPVDRPRHIELGEA